MLQQADLILHVGLNARLEATMLNVRIRQRWLRGGLTVGTIGAPVRLTYDAENLGLTPASLVELAEGKVITPCHPHAHEFQSLIFGGMKNAFGTWSRPSVL